MKYPINLSEANGMTESSPMKMERENHPVLTLHWDDDYELPDEGEMTVTFHKHRETNVDQEGKISQTVELHIMTIEGVKGSKEKAPKKSDRDEASEALDSYAAEAEED